MTHGDIPSGLGPHFQEYDLHTVNLDQDADLVIQRTLEYGTWNEVRWLFGTYGGPRIRAFVRERSERLLSPVTFILAQSVTATSRRKTSLRPRACRPATSIVKS
jgi:hypothetical protein